MDIQDEPEYINKITQQVIAKGFFDYEDYLQIIEVGPWLVSGRFSLYLCGECSHHLVQSLRSGVHYPCWMYTIGPPNQEIGY